MISVHANMAFTSVSLVTILIFSLYKSVFTSATATRFTTELIHRDSVNSPLFNPSHTRHDRFLASVNRSHTRFNILQQTILSEGRKSQTSFELGLTASNFEYLMTIQVGTPSRSILAIIDTGSDLIWTNCVRQQCHECYKQHIQFNPNLSSTFHELECDSDSCHLLDSVERNCSKERDSCRYKMSYGDGSLVYGLLAKETFAFNTSDGRDIEVPEVTFGCADVSNGTFDKHTTGMIGFGRGPLSLVSQLGPFFDYKFSYCLAPHTKNGSSSKVYIGPNALFSSPHAQSTPLIKTSLLPSTFFVVQLSGFKVGDLELETQNSNIVLDTGTTLTYLDQKLVQPIVEKVKNMILLQTVTDPNFDLCFKKGLNSSKIQYPDINLRLGTVNIKLGPEKSFYHWEDGKVCLNIVSSPLGFQILGNIAQQDLHLGYDLQKQRAYFASVDCTQL